MRRKPKPKTSYETKPKRAYVKKTQERSTEIISAKTKNQQTYIMSIIENDIIFCSGPSGTGKSFIALGIACEHLHRGDIDCIIIARPLVCVGKDIGALPGEVKQKIEPYLGPMQDNLKRFLGPYYGLYLSENKIRFEPIELMRGATFNHAYMILDEAQNCTFEQLKMFITRMGEGSKVMINGDTKQNDLKGKSGLDQCMAMLIDIEQIGINRLDYCDIQRNGILEKVLRALGD